MEGYELFSLILIIIQIAILLYIVVRSVGFISVDKISPVALFFAFGIIGFMASDFYWLVYAYLRPDVRMPFAVNEVGEWAGFLLIASSLNAVYKNSAQSRKLIAGYVAAIVFSTVCTAFWIAWSGEWLQDIISGIVCGYFFCMVVKALIVSDALGKRGLIILGAVSFVLLVCQGLTFIVPESVSFVPDIICYIIMFTSLAVLFVIFIVAWIKRFEANKLFALSTLGYAFGTSCMYMSADPMYSVPLIVVTFMHIFMMMSLRKVVEQE